MKIILQTGGGLRHSLQSKDEREHKGVQELNRETRYLLFSERQDSRYDPWRKGRDKRVHERQSSSPYAWVNDLKKPVASNTR